MADRKHAVHQGIQLTHGTSNIERKNKFDFLLGAFAFDKVLKLEIVVEIMKQAVTQC